MEHLLHRLYGVDAPVWMASPYNSVIYFPSICIMFPQPKLTIVIFSSG